LKKTDFKLSDLGLQMTGPLNDS